MASAVDTLVQSLPKEAPLRLHLRAELEKAHAAIADCIGVFADAEADSSRRAAAIIAMKESSAQWREKLHALRQTEYSPVNSSRAGAAFFRPCPLA